MVKNEKAELPENFLQHVYRKLQEELQVTSYNATYLTPNRGLLKLF